ncbi:hypothetical protein F4778DRAFT_427699 [Xylariomycetidae sp. FL2044]|nr:hypothetical protein F4778DRAFT_427699 [Xylariomycetidae sp. FL2044]
MDLSPSRQPILDGQLSQSTTPSSVQSTSHHANPKSSLGSRSRFTRHFSPRQSTTVSPSTSVKSDKGRKGPLGLTLLHQAAENITPAAHIVFVHGLGGGSEHTWSKDDTLWPRDLLPRHHGFQNTTIFSFGYDSDFKKSSTLNIHDFANSLVNGLLNNPLINDFERPIILVGHSMGGLVMKQAYILAKQMSVYKRVADSIKAMVFIATPHTGSELAPILDRLFRMTSGSKPYLDDLRRNSAFIQAINTIFPSQSSDLLLHSFYETEPLSIGGLRDVIIVPKADAVLNYAHEQSALLYGNHRSICKFASMDNHNFIAIWQAIAACIHNLNDAAEERMETLSTSSNDFRSNKELGEFLRIWESPADDLHQVKTDRLQGTCEWLGNDSDFQQWLNEGTNRKVFWLRGPPGCGKSHAAGHLIEEFGRTGKSCCYYFFRHDDKVKSSLENFLLSLAWQMSRLPDVQRRIIQVCARDRGVTSGDYRTLLRKLWDQAVFRADLGNEVSYWVIDAFDECRLGHDLAKFLYRALEVTRGLIKVIVTSRHPYSQYALPLTHVHPREILTSDIQADIGRYLDANHYELPGTTKNKREVLKEHILEKSNGCFLWVVLVLQRLRRLVGSQARLKALEETPPGMDQLYTRILSSALSREGISTAVLVWVTCAIRPLTTAELKSVLEDEAMDEIDDMEAVISQYCYDLVYVDEDSRVKMRHASTTRFLLRQDINPESEAFGIDEESGHKLLALACLKFLNGSEMKVKKRKMVATVQGRSIFAAYACRALHEHVNKCPAQDMEVLSSLSLFLKSNVLFWIEHLASSGDLETVLQFAQVLKIFLRRRSRTDLALEDELVTVEAWATDLVRLISRFGTQLLAHPESILGLIPPFCPSGTAPYTQFASSAVSAAVQVRGLSAKTWDDYLCAVSPSVSHRVTPSGLLRHERFYSLSATDDVFCIGTSFGRICIFNERTCLEERTVTHDGPVTHVHFGTSKPLLASFGKRTVRVWNTETWEQQWEVQTRQNCVALQFVDDDQILLVALQNNTLLALNLVNKTLESSSWTDNLDDPFRTWYHGIAPQCASFNPDLSLLAVGYSCRRVLVYNFELETHQLFDHEEGVSDSTNNRKMIQLYSMAFSNLPDTSLLAVNYSTAELVLFDTEQGTVKARISSVYISSLTSSPDGRTLAATRNDGAIELYDFESLHQVYRIRPEDGAVACFAFTADNTRFLVVRAGARNCAVWSPAALYRRDVGHDSVLSQSWGSGSQDGAYDQPEEEAVHISAITIGMEGEVYFIGKEDFSVTVYDAGSGLALDVLFSHTTVIKALEYGAMGSNSLLISMDTAGTLMVHKISRSGRQWTADCLFRHWDSSIFGVQQFLCRPDMSRILVYSKDHAIVLSSMTGKESAAPLHCEGLDNEICIWANHPTDPTLLLRLTATTIWLYSWSSLERVSSIPEGTLVANSLLPELKVCGADTIFTGPNAMLITRCNLPRISSHSTLTCIAAHALTAQADSVTPLFQCQPVFEKIDSIIGMFRDRLVFLHRMGWVCSVKPAGMRGEGNEKIMFHFAPPLDWLRTNRLPLMMVSKIGDVLFVVKGEVAIVKRGLNRVVNISKTS